MSHLSDALLHAIAAFEAAHDAHLDTCADCRGKVEQLRALDALLRVSEDAEPSPGFDARMRDALTAERAATGTAGARWRAGLAKWLRPGVLAPALGGVAVAALALVIALPTEPTEDELFMAQHQEMLAELDLLRDLDAAEDFEVIAALGADSRDDDQGEQQ